MCGGEPVAMPSPSRQSSSQEETGGGILGFLMSPTGIFFIVFYIFIRRKIRNAFGGHMGRAGGASQNFFLGNWSDVHPPRGNRVDGKKRDDVIKQTFSTEKLPSELDAIVIGSGIGGLTTAALLAKKGQKVLVLEQHDQAGGCCHSFTEKGFEFDVGIHYLGEVGCKAPNRTKILVDFITNGQLEFVPTSNNFDEVRLRYMDPDPSKTLSIKMQTAEEGGKMAWIEALQQQFPEEKETIQEFVSMVNKALRSMQSCFIVKALPLWLSQLLIKLGLVNWWYGHDKWMGTPIGKILDDLTSNEDLKAALVYICGDIGCNAEDGTFGMLAQLHRHYWRGSYYPLGGPSEIAFRIIPVIEAAGGKVLVRANVTAINVNSQGKVTGVTVQKGKSVYQVNCPVVISDAGVLNTFGRLLPKEVAMKVPMGKITTSLNRSPAGFQVFVGFRGSTKDLNLPARNVWAFTSNDINGCLMKQERGPLEDQLDSDVRLMFVSFPSAKDPDFERRHPGKSVVVIVTFMNYDWFKEWEKTSYGKRDDEYEGLKKTLGDKMVEQLYVLFPQLEGKLEYVSFGSPLSHNYYLNVEGGEIYGLRQDINRFSLHNQAILRPQTGIPGLFMTGQDIAVVGFAGALYGGLFSASAVLGLDLFQDLSGAYQDLKAQWKTSEEIAKAAAESEQCVEEEAKESEKKDL